MKKLICFITLVNCTFLSFTSVGQTLKKNKINLSGAWTFAVDSLDQGVKEQWYNRTLPEVVHLPGSMTTNNKGDDVSLNTPWTGGLWNIDWFKDPNYAKYREPGNIKISFWLQPVKHYIGVAWYKKSVVIPLDWSDKHIELLAQFTTDYYSNWEWQDGLRNSNAIRLDSLSADIKPIVRVIDDWFTARPLGLILECRVGNWSLLISGIDLLTDQENRPGAKQLFYSL